MVSAEYRNLEKTVQKSQHDVHLLLILDVTYFAVENTGSFRMLSSV